MSMFDAIVSCIFRNAMEAALVREEWDERDDAWEGVVRREWRE